MALYLYFQLCAKQTYTSDPTVFLLLGADFPTRDVVRVRGVFTLAVLFSDRNNSPTNSYCCQKKYEIQYLKMCHM